MSQIIDVYVRASGTKGTIVDAFNVGAGSTPSFAIFTDTEIHLHLFRDASTAYTRAELLGYAWEFWADEDWDRSTSPKIGTTSGIAVASDGALVIPVDTGNEALVEWLGSASEKGLKAELLGFDGTSREYADFCVQFEVKATNRVFYSGQYTPSPIESLYYTKSQADGRFATINYVGSTFQTKLPIQPYSTRQYFLRENGTFQPIGSGTGSVSMEVDDNLNVRLTSGANTVTYTPTTFSEEYESVDIKNSISNDTVANIPTIAPSLHDTQSIEIRYMVRGSTVHDVSYVSIKGHTHSSEACGVALWSDGNPGDDWHILAGGSTTTILASTVNDRLDALEEVDGTLDDILGV